MAKSHELLKPRPVLRSAVVAASLAALAATGRAATITNPAGLQAGDPFYVVFVTDGSRDATSTNIADYDSFVANDAGATTYNGSSVTWQALGTIASGVTAISRFDPDAPIYRLDGVKVANNGTDLWDGTIDVPLDVSPTSSGVDAQVWTGTASDGTEDKGLGGVTTTLPGGDTNVSSNTGNAANTDSGWIDVSDEDPADAFRLYGFSSELIAVPEPATATLLAAGAVAALSLRRRAR